MRFDISIIVPLALLVESAFSLSCFPFCGEKDNIKYPVKCNQTYYEPPDMKRCIKDLRKNRIEIPRRQTVQDPLRFPRAFDKQTHHFVKGEGPWQMWPMIHGKAWIQGDNPGWDRCLIDGSGRVAGFLTIDQVWHKRFDYDYLSLEGEVYNVCREELSNKVPEQQPSQAPYYVPNQEPNNVPSQAPYHVPYDMLEAEEDSDSESGPDKFLTPTRGQ
ncbi:unnamed protein product [Diplocarpon coronariae]